MFYKLLCKVLCRTDVNRIDALLKAAVACRQELLPDWDMVYIALPKNEPKRRTEMLRAMLRFEENNQQKDTCF